MYNTKFICTYKSYSDPYLSDTFYRKNLLEIFNIEDLNFEKHESEICDEMVVIFEKIKSHREFAKCMDKTSLIFSIEEKLIAFMILMSYDFFYLTHPCVSEFLDEGTISDDKIKALMTAIA